MGHLTNIIICFSIFFIFSCSHIDQNTRTPATSSFNQSCADIMNRFLSSRLSNKMLSPVKENIINKGSLFWEKHFLSNFTDSNFFLRDTKRKWIQRFMNINANDYPAFYLNSKDEDYIIIKKIIDILSAQKIKGLTLSEKKIVSRVNRWISEYKNFDLHMNNYLKDYFSLDYAIEQMKRNRPGGFPDYQEYEILVNGKVQIKAKMYASSPEYDAHINYLKRKKKKYLNGFFFKKGIILDRQFKQVVLKRRLTFVQRDLVNLIVTNGRNGAGNGEELLKLVDDIEKVLKIDHIKPTIEHEKKLLNKELNEEFKDIFNTINDHKAIREGRLFYKSLSKKEIKDYNLDKVHGFSGDVVSFVKKNKYYVLVTTLGTGGGISAGAISLKNFLNFDKNNLRENCIKEPNPKFISCFVNYLKVKYKIKDPIAYYNQSHDKLLSVFNNDKELLDQFLFEKVLMKQERKKYLEKIKKAKKLENDFKKEMLKD